MKIVMSYATAADQVGELVALAAAISVREVTGEPRNLDEEARFSELLGQTILNIQKGLAR